MATEGIKNVEQVIIILARAAWADVDLDNKNSVQPRFERLTALVALCRSFELAGIETEIGEMLQQIDLSAHKNKGIYNKSQFIQSNCVKLTGY